MPMTHYQRPDWAHKEFQPLYEWKHEDNKEILLVDLPPGIQKESIKVTAEDRKNLRVLGERLVEGKKLDQFDELFEVPKACKLSEIDTKFQNGILTITIPARKITKTQKSMKTAKQNKDSANPSSSNSYANLPPLIPTMTGDGHDLQQPLKGVTKSEDEEKPDQKPLDKVEEKEPLIDDIVKINMDMESSKNSDGIIARVKDFKRVVKGLPMVKIGAVVTPAAAVVVVALGVYVYYTIGASGNGN